MDIPDIPNDKFLENLIAQLERAVRAGNRNEALELRAQIFKYLAEQSRQIDNIELKVDDIIGGLDVLPPNRGVIAQMEEVDHVDFPVWFATNRKELALQGESIGIGFGGERNQTSSKGRATVTIPLADRPISITPNDWPRRRNPKKDLRVLTPLTKFTTDEDFFADMWKEKREEALIFIHGFNNTFEESVKRAAQVGYDLGINGPTALFSWPSRGRLDDYMVDEATIEASERHIEEFISAVVATTQQPGFSQTPYPVHVIAHSMGNRGFLRALQRISANVERRKTFKLGQIILAAADVDADLFKDLSFVYPEFAARTTAYISPNDHAVCASAVLHEAPRMGYFDPYTSAKGIDTVAVKAYRLEHLGLFHSYFGESLAVLNDMSAVMHGVTPARSKFYRESATTQPIWQLQVAPDE